MSALIAARTGRHRQRYEDEFRLVAGCIPYKFNKDVEDETVDSNRRLEVLMISSPDQEDLVFPKGGWEDDETIVEAACREALEEAGVRGILDENHLGWWEFRSKSRQNSCSLEGGCKGYMFALKVTEELDNWPEEHKYRRQWLSVKEALRLCRYDWMRKALNEFLEVLSETGKYTMSKEESDGLEDTSNAVSVVDVVVKEKCLGRWEFRGESKQNSCSLEGGCRGFLMMMMIVIMIIITIIMLISATMTATIAVTLTVTLKI